jgi:4-hydroxybenzoate polyprenyltransferase
MTRQRTIAWLQLIRLPNVFTAVADVMMGYLVTHGSLQPASHFAILAAASCMLYLSGMVLNDVFDAEVDAQERPDRPIPSGRIPKRAAAACGLALLASGMLITWFTSFLLHDSRPATIGTLLAVSIVLYDYILKRTPLAPLVMGACRTLNVLLGMSLAAIGGLATSVASDNAYFVQWNTPGTWLIALGIGTYIVGVTWFARTEARTSGRAQLVGGTIILLTGMALLAALPIWSGSGYLTPPLRVSINGWYLLWAALALITARRCILAISSPTPDRVQTAVRHLVQTIIVLDAAVCVGYASPLWGFAVLALLAPTLLLANWLKAT